MRAPRPDVTATRPPPPSKRPSRGRTGATAPTARLVLQDAARLSTRGADSGQPVPLDLDAAPGRPAQAPPGAPQNRPRKPQDAASRLGVFKDWFRPPR